MNLFVATCVSTHKGQNGLIWRVRFVRDYGLWIQIMFDPETREVNYNNYKDAWAAYNEKLAFFEEWSDYKI